MTPPATDGVAFVATTATVLPSRGHDCALSGLVGFKRRPVPESNMSKATKVVLGTVGLSAVLAVGIILALALG